MRICDRCVYDDSVWGVYFDEEGICNYCKMHDQLEKIYPQGPQGENILEQKCEDVRARGKKRDYDCVVGVSGGRDSTYLLWKAKQMGLRPLAVHYDNGWNSEIAVRNIERATEKLGVNLITVVEDWDEFQELQVSFLKSSTPDAEIPTDIGLKKAIMKIADQFSVKTVFTGYSFRTEGISPLGWTYMDGKYIDNVYKQFTGKRLRKFHNFKIADVLYYVFLRRMTFFYPLNYIQYDQASVTDMITNELGWQYYGGHHHENSYTEFFQSYYLPVKFKIDKRKTELSALIRSRQVSRSEALKILEEPYEYNPDLIPYVRKKLGLSPDDFDAIMSSKPRRFIEFPSYYTLTCRLRPLIKFLCGREIFPPVFYLKYLAHLDRPVHVDAGKETVDEVETVAKV